MTKKLRVLHVSPTYFSSDSIMGGGERFVQELAKAMSVKAEVELLYFGRKAKNYSEDNVSIKVIKPLFFIKNNLLNPFQLVFYSAFKNADIIHVHQLYTFLTEICILWARILGKPIFITDHGGGGRTFLTRFGIARLATGFLPVSEYSSNKLSSIHPLRLAIYGGVDPNIYRPMSDITKIDNRIISVGRILPHKGFHHLIEAVSEEELIIIGQPSDSSYFHELKKLALNKNVKFLSNLNDQEVRKFLASSSLAVFASTNRGISGEILEGEPELLGIAPLESMAMNIPTIVSNVGAYPEICFDEKHFLFQHDQVDDLKIKIKQIWNYPKLKDVLFSEYVKSKFTWEKAASKCLAFYQQYGREK